MEQSIKNVLSEFPVKGIAPAFDRTILDIAGIDLVDLRISTSEGIFNVTGLQDYLVEKDPTLSRMVETHRLYFEKKVPAPILIYQMVLFYCSISQIIFKGFVKSDEKEVRMR